MKATCPACGSTVDLGSNGYVFRAIVDIIITPHGRIELKPPEGRIFTRFTKSQQTVTKEEIEAAMAGERKFFASTLWSSHLYRLNKRLKLVGLAIKRVQGKQGRGTRYILRQVPVPTTFMLDHW